MDAFSLAINGWHDFYIMVGTAAATLVGLLFVSLSLNADAIAQPVNADLRALEEQTFSTFLYILSFAIVFLIPNQEPLGLGLPLLFLGGFGLFSTLFPLAASIVGAHPLNPLATVCLSANCLLYSISAWGTWSYASASRQLLADESDCIRLKHVSRIMLLVAIGLALAIPLAFISVYITYAIWIFYTPSAAWWSRTRWLKLQEKSDI